MLTTKNFLDEKKEAIEAKLSTTCRACGKEYKPSNISKIGYTENLVPYCLNQFECKSLDHINSVTSVNERGSLIKLAAYKDVLNGLFDDSITPREKEIFLAIKKPITFRCADVHIMGYLYDLGEGNINKAVKDIVMKYAEGVISLPSKDYELPDNLTSAPVKPEVPEVINLSPKHTPALEPDPADEVDDLWEV